MIRNSMGIAGLLKAGVILVVVLLLAILPLGQNHFLYADEDTEKDTLVIHLNNGTELTEEDCYKLIIPEHIVPDEDTLRNYISNRLDNYVFAEWNDESDGSGNTIKAHEGFGEGPYDIYAIWYEPVTCSGTVEIAYVYEEDGISHVVPKEAWPDTLLIRLYRQDDPDVHVDLEDLSHYMDTATMVTEQMMVLEVAEDETKATGEFLFEDIPYTSMYIAEVILPDNSYLISYKTLSCEEYKYNIGLFEWDDDYVNQQIWVRLVYNPNAQQTVIEDIPKTQPEQKESNPQEEKFEPEKIVPVEELEAIEEKEVPIMEEIPEMIMDADALDEVIEVRIREEQKIIEEEKRKKQEIKIKQQLDTEIAEEVVVETETEATCTQTVGAPDTGDHTPIELCVCLMMASLMGASMLRRRWKH